MKVIKNAILILSFVATLISCRNTEIPRGINSTEIAETAVLLTGTKIAKTQSVIPTATLTAIPYYTASPFPGENVGLVNTPRPDQHVYLDPNGWFSVTLPDWMEQDDETPGLFAIDGGRIYIEIGYLSGLGTMSNINNVCAWLANVVEKDKENLYVFWDFTNYRDRCSVQPEPGTSPFIEYKVFENPSAALELRFAYIKTNSAHIEYGFYWLKNTSETKFVSALPPISHKELAEWEHVAPLLQNVSVTEYELPPGSNPYQEMLLSAIPEDVLEARRALYSSSKEEEPALEEQLKALGYELTSDEWGGNKKLYRDGRLLFENFYKIFGVYEFSASSGPVTAFVLVLHPAQREAFLILNDAIYPWAYSHQEPEPASSPILYEDELLWLKVSDDRGHVQVWKSTQEVIYSFAVSLEPLYFTRKFTSWNGHWVWVARDFLIQDGEILNEKLGFQEIFEWRLIENQPAYLFRKDGRVGFSYAGKTLPLEYQNVARYLCCGYASNNPSIGGDSAHFFAEREGVWYYVVVDFR